MNKLENSGTIDFFNWVKRRQRFENDLIKRSHMSTIIKYYNLLERCELLGRDIKSAHAVPKGGQFSDSEPVSRLPSAGLPRQNSLYPYRT